MAALYLLTGAAGNLGSSVSRELVRQGKTVRALVLKGDPAAERVPEGVEIVVGDLLDDASLERFFSIGRGAEAEEEGTETVVIHCASIVTMDPEYNRKVYEVNVEGTRSIVGKCLKHGVRKLVYVSSIGAIPEPPKGQVIREVDSFDPDSVIGYYAKTKAEATQIVLDAVHNEGLDASIVYPTGIFGPYDYAYGLVAGFIIAIAQEKLPVGIDGYFNAVDVRDLANGVIACAEKGRKGEGYIMGNQAFSLPKLFRLVSRLTGSREVKIFLPLSIANVLVSLLEALNRVARKRSPITRFLVYNLARNIDFSSEKAERELGYRVRPFEQTIVDEVEWLRSEGKLGNASASGVALMSKAGDA